ncbi:MAG TPA: helix-turn-helix domain-containing protein [Thermoleophilaceae bacterium]|jgi:AcrR family transcriptional regulator
MVGAQAYRTRQRGHTRSERTRERIMQAVRELLAEGKFHESTVEEVAERAGISRATLYQHFRSRLDLVDAICDTFAVNPALVEIRDTVELPDAEAALTQTIALAMRFWASEDGVLSQLYGVVAIDPAAHDLVVRQREDRRGELGRLARHLARAGRLRDGVSERDAHDQLMVLTSYETFRELRGAGRSEQRVTRFLQDSARALLLA